MDGGSRSLSEARKVCVEGKGIRFPGADNRKGWNKDRGRESKGSVGLAKA